MNQTFLKVIIKNKDGEETQEDIAAVSSINEKGPFDILPFHENFISVIKEKLIIHKRTGEKKEMNFSTAILKAKENIINIYIGLSSKN